MNKVVTMNRLQGGDRLREVETRLFLRERISSNQERHHVTAR